MTFLDPETGTPTEMARTWMTLHGLVCRSGQFGLLTIHHISRVDLALAALRSDTIEGLTRECRARGLI